MGMRITVIAVMSLAFASAALVVIDEPLTNLIALVVAAAGLIFLTCALLRRRWHRTDASRGPGAPMPDVPHDERALQEDILTAIAAVDAQYNAPVIAMFTRMLIHTRYCQRVTERAELLGNSMRMHVSTDFVMSSSDRTRIKEPASLPVPLLRISKGTLLDNLDVTDGADASIPLLSQHEARGLVALTLEALFYVTFKREPVDTEAETQQLAALWALRRLVSRMGRLDTHWEDFRSAIESQAPDNEERLADLTDFCMFFAVNYVVVADVPTPAGTRFIVKYAKTNALDIPNTFYGRWRARVGLVPYEFTMPLNLAFTAESYHFRMDLGDAQFVNEHYIARPNGHHVAQEELRQLTGGGYVRVRSQSAQPYAHLYARKLDTVPHPTNLVSVVQFAETPPGALGATTVVAAVSVALIAIMTFVAPATNGPNADTSALLLAVPLFAATLVGHSIERVQRSALFTYAGLLITGVIAFLSAMVFGLLPGTMSIKKVDIFGLFTLPNVNIFGMALSAVGVVLVVFLWWRWRYQTGRYLHMLTRSSNAGPS